MDPWLSGALIIAALLLASIAALSALETAVRNARRSRLPNRGGKRAQRAATVIESADTFHASAHLAKALAEAAIYPLGAFVGLELALVRQGMAAGSLRHLPAGTWPGLILGCLGVYLGVTILGEVLPKSLAARHPEQVVMRHAGFIYLFTLLFAPALWPVRGMARWLTRSAGTDPNAISRAAHSEEEIKLLVEDSAEEGVLEEDEMEMIHSIFEFTDTVARQIMVPRIDIRSVSLEATAEDTARTILESGHSRIPVYRETLDTIVGIVHAKDVLSCLMRDERGVPLPDLMREPFFVPEAKPIDELLQEFREHKSQMAIVVDEYGGTSGLVTIEDVLEEIVGEIHDEYDQVPEPETQEAETGSGTIVDARMTVQDVNEELGLELPEDEYDTIGGLVFGLFGHAPSVGERIAAHGAEFVAEAMEGIRLLKVRIIAEQPDREPAQAEVVM